MRTDVRISGMGVISALGSGLEATLHALAAEEVNAGPAAGIAAALRGPVFAAPCDFAGASSASRTFHLCRAAAAEALTRARLDEPAALARTGVCLGTTVACQLNDVEFYAACKKGTPPSMEPVFRYLHGNLAEAVAIAVGAGGPACTVVNACSAGADAIGTALQWIRSGLCERVLAGGADELNRIPLCGFRALGIVAESVCRPFDRDRQGLNLGEGAGALLLEAAPAARVRQAPPTGLCVAGYGAAADAYHLTAPHPEGRGLQEAIRLALADADVGAPDIAFINAHGTATPDNDRVEGGVLARLFDSPVFLSTKGYTGHTLGAAGGIEAVLSALGLREGWIPPSAGFQNRDPALTVAPVGRRTRIAGTAALSTSLAFGGNNAALVLGLDAPQGSGRP